jgi:regulatory protein
MQKRNKERVNVYLDGDYAFSLPLIEAAKLRKGQALTDDDIASLRVTDAVHKAVDQAVRFLSYRPRSTAEVRQNLEKKDYTPAIVEAAMERLEHLGYVDDMAFARFWLENRSTFKPRGAMALRYELRQKGIGDAIIDQVLDDLDEDDGAYRAASEKARRLRGSDRETFRRKLGGFLQRRGFGFETCRNVIDQIEIELAETGFFAGGDAPDQPEM